MSKQLKNKKIADHSDPPDEVYDKARDLIPLKDRKEFDAIIEEEIETEDKLEEYLFSEIADYLDEEICPDGFAFGVHEISQDIGIWKIGEKSQRLDVPYKGMVDRRDEEKKISPSRKVNATVLDEEEKIPNDVKQSNDYRPSTKEEIIKEVSKVMYRQKMEILKLIKEM